MSEGLFTQQTRGVGADTGQVTLHVAGESAQFSQSIKTVCQWEQPGGEGEPSARRKGPLLLSVAVNTQQINALIAPPSQAGPNIAAPLPSRLNGYGVLGDDEFPNWGYTGFEYGMTLAGSLILTLQVGAVARTLTADLVSGTYALPPCDRVTVTAGIRRVESAEECLVDVAASVSPGSMTQAQPLIFSDVAGYTAENFPTEVFSRDFTAPEGASHYLPFNFRLPGGLVGATSFYARSRLGAIRNYAGEPAAQQWYVLPAPQQRVTMDFGWTGLTEENPPACWVGARWRVDP